MERWRDWMWRAVTGGLDAEKEVGGKREMMEFEMDERETE